MSRIECRPRCMLPENPDNLCRERQYLCAKKIGSFSSKAEPPLPFVWHEEDLLLKIPPFEALTNVLGIRLLVRSSILRINTIPLFPAIASGGIQRLYAVLLHVVRNDWQRISEKQANH